MQNEKRKTGVLLVNLGTPDAPTTSAVRKYLAEFLWDIRVVDAPRILWWLILNGLILRIRPSRSAKKYQSIWMKEGSPLLVYSRLQAKTCQKILSEKYGDTVKVVLAMRYGSPSIALALNDLKKAGVGKIIVLPLYPQYSLTTTESVNDKLSEEIKKQGITASIKFISDYHDDANYIAAMAKHIQSYWRSHSRGEKIILSFHGIPERYCKNGDPYDKQCRKTAALLAEALGLSDQEWQLTFQSRVGREPWLQPYTDKVLKALPSENEKGGTQSVDVFCPGFSVDCLETLEEIAMENRDYFLQAGGEQYHYIPALNDNAEHIEALVTLIEKNM